MEAPKSNKTGKKASKTQNFYANEVCYGLAVAADLGFSAKEAVDFVFDDLKKWSKKALPKERKS